jgi:hypothetical protein
MSLTGSWGNLSEHSIERLHCDLLIGTIKMMILEQIVGASAVDPKGCGTRGTAEGR